MSYIKFIASILALFFLIGCTSYSGGKFIPLPQNNQSAAGFDPDGDGDSKGFGYFSLKRHATGRWVFVFDPNYGAWAAYNENGDLVNTGRASGGKDFCPDVNRGCRTISGRFRILRKGDAECESRIYPIETDGGAPMPYCMFFSDRGYAIHGSHDVPNGNASHGCIRITPTAAQWMSERFVLGSTVIVLPYL